MKINDFTSYLCVAVCLFLSVHFTPLFSQTGNCIYNLETSEFEGPDGGPCLNTISTSVIFLRIAPDARSGAMGDAGIAMSPDANAMAFNASRLAFAEDNFELAGNYTPWLQALGLSDVFMAYLSSYVNLDELQTIGFDLRYFSLGEIDYIDNSGVGQGSGKPNEFSVSAAYARKLGDQFSVSLAGRFIYSNLANGQEVNSAVIKPGTALAADIGMLYKIPLNGGSIHRSNSVDLGLAISNLGTKIKYLDIDDSGENYIPANIGIGANVTLSPDDYNQFTFAVDVNKLLVPTPCLVDNDSGIDCDEDNNDRPDYLEYSAVRGALVSFSDAPPGDSELNELMYSLGAEYMYNQQFAVRAGYFSEHRTKGNRKYLTVGAGFTYNVITVNLSYLLPTTNQRSALDNTFRFSILYNGGSSNEF